MELKALKMENSPIEELSEDAKQCLYLVSRSSRKHSRKGSAMNWKKATQTLLNSNSENKKLRHYLEKNRETWQKWKFDVNFDLDLEEDKKIKVICSMNLLQVAVMKKKIDLVNIITTFAGHTQFPFKFFMDMLN